MAAAFDYKKELKALYQPAAQPVILTVPPAHYVAVRGEGDPNQEDGAYKQAVGVLYAISYTIKMSERSGKELPGYFAYVVPPLEGMWWMADGRPGVDYAHKEGFCWVSMIRLPEFVTPEILEWAKAEAAAKKGLDTAKAEFLTLDEGECCQCMHLGPFDDEPATMEKMEAYVAAAGYRTDHSETRRHHEIYLGDPRKCAPEKLRTVLRLPVARL